MNPVEALSDSRSDLWRGIPISNQYQQRKLVGWERDSLPPDAVGPEQRRIVLENDRHRSLQSFLHSTGFAFNVVILGVYHLLLQRYLDDAESVIGCCLLERARSSGRTATLRPSHVYAEEDDSVTTLLAQIEHQLRAAPAIEIDPAGASSWGAGRAPVFFFVGAATAGAVDGEDPDPLASPTSDHLIMLAAAAGDDTRPASIRLAIPAAMSRAVAAEDFARHFDVALSLMLSQRCPSIGDLKSQLDVSSELPRHQLDDMQQRVVALWGRVLGIEGDALRESSSYFEVGGTSLNAFKLVNRVRLEFQRDISVRDIMEFPTVREFSRLLLTR